MRTQFIKLVAKLTAIATILSSVMSFSPVKAAALTSVSDTLTRVAVSTTADHTVVFTLPTGVTLDSTTNVDTLQVDFPSDFTLASTWVTGDFTFNDGTARTVSAVSQGGGTIDCTPGGGANDVCVAVDTTNNIFTIEVGASYSGSGAAATITFTIDGTAGDGTLTNPATAGSKTVSIAMCDETAGCPTSFVSSHSTSIGIGIADSDQVSVTASVDPSLTFDLDTVAVDSCSTTETAAPYSVALGTLTTGSVRVSGATDTVNSICVDVNTNAAGGAVVTVANANGSSGLVSASVPADDINNSAATMAAGTENYGLCVAAVSQTTGGPLAKAAPYDTGTCTVNGETNEVKALSTTPTNILNTTTDPIAGGRAQILVQAAVSGTTPAHSDYADTLTFVATGTF